MCSPSPPDPCAAPPPRSLCNPSPPDPCATGAFLHNELCECQQCLDTCLKICSKRTRTAVYKPILCNFAPPINATLSLSLSHTQGRLVDTWNLEHNAAAPPPQSPVLTSRSLANITLIPYGATKLRIAELPTVLG